MVQYDSESSYTQIMQGIATASERDYKVRKRLYTQMVDTAKTILGEQPNSPPSPLPQPHFIREIINEVTISNPNNTQGSIKLEYLRNRRPGKGAQDLLRIYPQYDLDPKSHLSIFYVFDHDSRELIDSSTSKKERSISYLEQLLQNLQDWSTPKSAPNPPPTLV